MFSDRDSLTAAIKADLLRPDKPKNTNVTPCVTCGRATLIQNGDPQSTYCSTRCKEALARGLLPRFTELPSTDSIYTKRWKVVAPADGEPGYMLRPMRMGKEDFLVACAHCRREFDSKGWRCCLAECERSYRAKESRATVMAEADMELPTKRQCLECGADIPNWRSGRRVRQDSQFCSKACAQKNRRKNGLSEADISET